VCEYAGETSLMIKTDAVIVGAGPTGLFCAHQLGIIGLKCEIIDNLDKIGGQCIELYPDKPIYDIPAVPECTGEELTNNLIEQIKPFNFNFYLNDRVQELIQENENWLVKTTNGKEFMTPNVIIAGGVGSFEPRKFPTKSAEKFDGTSVLYSIKDKTIFKDKSVVIFGGGDSALDWAIELSKNSKVSLVHRREEFRGAASSVQKIKELSQKNMINLFTKYSIKDVKGNSSLEEVEIKNENGESKKIKADYVLGFFGLIMQLGPIAEWGLNLDKKVIPVNTENFETNKKGIFAIGDICTYPGKLKLILSGFHEGALAARGCFKYARPNEKYRFEFTTASNTIKDRLGIK
jgi:thioredoxin reductase (NADPH)